jgi:hypothetical protein
MVSMPYIVAAQDSLNFKGQLSLWSNYNPAGSLDLWFGGRYIPQLNYNIRLPGNKLIDFELSANLNATAAMNPFDTINAEALIKPYRGWVRYSTSNFELRLGLQKINFGSASILRPLMWFDQMDPRDPLQLTNGVWALLGRYYFLNNANLLLHAKLFQGSKNLLVIRIITYHYNHRNACFFVQRNWINHIKAGNSDSIQENSLKLGLEPALINHLNNS